MLTADHLLALAPLIIVLGSAVVLMLGIAWRRHHTASAILAAVGLVLALLALVPLWPLAPIHTPLLVIDAVALYGSALVLLAALATVGLAHGYLAGYAGRREEFYLLLLCATGGGMTLVASRHLASLFLGLELLSMPLYGLLAYRFHSRPALEAGIKYLVLSATATTFLLFGMALLYAESGALDLGGVAKVLDAPGAWGLAGGALMLVGLGFKLGIVPFHLWVADVYDGGPAPAVAFLASASKVAAFVVLLRLVVELAPFRALDDLLAGLALLGMVVGNLLALRQANLKRLLAYSSIAHIGYLLVVLAVGEGLAVETGGIYLLVYLVTIVGAFGVISLLSSPCCGEETVALAHYRGLFWSHPALALVLALCLLSLAGIPLTAGFIGKFYLVALGVEAQRWWLVGGIILGSAIGLYYYLRVMITLFLPMPGEGSPSLPARWWQEAGGVVVLGMAALVIFIGVYPVTLIDWVRLMSGALAGSPSG